MGRKSKYPLGHRLRAVSLVRMGATKAEVASKYGCSRTTLQRWLVKHAHRDGKHWFPLEVKLKAVALVKGGTRRADVADQVGCSREALRNWMVKYAPSQERDPRSNRFTVRTRTKAVEMALCGEYLYVIAEKLGCSLTTVRNWVREFAPEYQERKHERREWAMDIYLQGHSLTKASKVSGMPVETLRRSLLRAGHEIRPRHTYRMRSQATRNRAMKLLEGSGNPAEVARVIGCCPKTVRRWAVEEDISY